ncbi:hypothetical protein L7F22_066791 [Adiantum nelumboides]|nr:hypothetical protein [Adiantum nelumboides]
MANNNEEGRINVDNFDFAHEGANDETPMLVKYLITRLQQAMASPALQGEVQARWRAPKVRCPLHTIFCQTKKDFNNHYGLDTEGKDPRLLKDSNVSEGDWLSVFSHSKDTSSYRVKCSSLRPEQYEDLLIFYMKVYQKRPTNMEVNVSFARAYVLQFSPRAVKAGRSVQFAWAIVGEEHNNDLKKSGHFHTHYLRWKVINGAGDLIVGTVNAKEPNIELTPPPPIAPLASHSLLTVAKDGHATCLKKLEAGKVQQLSDEKFGKALSLLDEQISAKKLKLASVAEDDPVTRIQLASQLEAQESMQAVLGVGSSEPANVPMLTDEVEFLADVVKEKEMQHNLLQEMLHRVEVGRRAYICPPPPSVMSPTLDNFTLPAKCAGCGYGHNVNKALMLVMLPCKHTYHSMCFATLCAFTDQCMPQYCSMAIPRDAESTVIWGDDSHVWYFDNGATKHITSHRDLFTSLESVPHGNSVTCANNASYPVQGVEKIVLTAANGSSFTLVDALYVLGIKKNLLSVSALARLGLVVKFVDDRCTVHDLSFGDEIVASGILCHGLHKLTLYDKCGQNFANAVVDTKPISDANL